jgi:hypothetical protein
MLIHLMHTTHSKECDCQLGHGGHVCNQIKVQGQAGQKVSEILSHLIKSWVWWSVLVISATGEA